MNSRMNIPETTPDSTLRVFSNIPNLKKFNKLRVSIDSSLSANRLQSKRNSSVLTNVSVSHLKTDKMSKKRAFLVKTIVDLKKHNNL